MAEDERRASRHAILVPILDPMSNDRKGGVINALSRPQLLNAARKFIAGNVRGAGGLDALRRAPRRDVVAAVAAARAATRAKLVADPATNASQVGFLLLERVVYFPAGTLPGDEVVRRLLIAPGGEVEITKKTWSKVSLEFSDATTQIRDEERESSQVATKELSESTHKQQQLSISLSATAQASGGFGPVMSATASATSSLDTAQTSVRDASVRRTQNETGKASARMHQEHRMTFTERREFGTESTTTERLRNPNTSHPVVVSLVKQLLRWNVRLEQYGVRLCVDVMVRNPGRNLRAGTVPRAFNPDDLPQPDPDAPPPGAPPVPDAVMQESRTVTFGDGRGHKAVAFHVPEGYEIDFCTAVGEDGGACSFSEVPDPGFVDGSALGLRYAANYLGHHVNNYDNGNAANPTVRSVTVTAFFALTAAGLDAWRQKARPSQIAEAARLWQQEELRRQSAEASREAASTVPPAQVMRKEERDELLSGVARFMAFGEPEPQPTAAKEVAVIAPTVIRLLHDAFEWDGMTSLLYPYWWDTTAFEGVPGGALSLQHPDFLRKEFVRASWARVVVPVKLGREPEVLEYLYGPAFREAYDAKNVNAAAPNGALVEAALNIAEACGEDGPFAAPVAADSTARIVLAEWQETTPTDETCPTMDLLRDADGNAVDVAEPYLRQWQDSRLLSVGAIARMHEVLAENAEAGNMPHELDATTESDSAKVSIRTA